MFMMMIIICIVVDKKLLNREIDVWAPCADVVTDDSDRIVIEKSVFIRIR